MSENRELAPGELQVPEVFYDAVRDFLGSGRESGVIPSPDPDISIDTLLLGFLIAVKNLELEDRVSVSMDAGGVRLERSDLPQPTEHEVPEHITKMVELFLASGQEDATVDFRGGEVPNDFLRMVIDGAIRKLGYGIAVWVDEDDAGELWLHRLPSDLTPDDEDLGDVEMFTEIVGGFLESDAPRWTMGDAGSARATMLYVRRLAMAAEDLGVMDRIAISIDGDSIVLSRND